MPALTPLPQIDPATGLLPPGRHLCSWGELEKIFVNRAPQVESRRFTYRALRLYADMVDGVYPGARLWINGGFVTYKPDPPFDADVTIVAPRPVFDVVASEIDAERRAWLAATASGSYDQKCPTLVRNWGLLSIPGLLAPFIPKLQPFGGYIDGFVVADDDAAGLAYWHNLWSGLMPGSNTVEKGYVEVVNNAR